MSSQRELLAFFVDLSARFIQQYLGHIDIARMKQDRFYATKVFLLGYAYARAGAPGGYSIAAIKSVSAIELGMNSEARLWSVFQDFYHGKTNKNANPCADHALMQTDFSDVFCTISEGRVEEAFSRLAFRGVKHKIRSLFIRDMVYLTKADLGTERNIDWYLYAQPIDVWIRKTAGPLIRKDATRPLEYDPAYLLNQSDFDIATRIIASCLHEGYSPLKLNMGIWYYCARVVADAGRLRKILKDRSVEMLGDELALIEEFLPK